MVKRENNKLKFPLKEKYVALLAPSFIVDFEYPQIILKLRGLGFDKIVELTFGAKLINKEYYATIKNSKSFFISSVCPGIVETIKNSFPEYKDNLLMVDSPMIATSKVCKKIYPQHKQIFISPCNFKKIESKKSDFIDYVIDYKELNNILNNCLKKSKKTSNKSNQFFDKFYNDYTKIYPLAGGLSKTLRIKNLLKDSEIKSINGINKTIKFLKKPDKSIRFLDTTFCKEGCIDGPCINSKSPLYFRKKKVLKYLKLANQEKIPDNRKGIFKEAKGLSFKSDHI